MTLLVRPFSWQRIAWAVSMLALLLALTAIVARAREGGGPSGEGAQAVGSFVIREVHYSVSASEPMRVDGITFQVTASDRSGVPGRVTVSIDQGRHWITCQHAGGLSWVCPLQASISGLTSLRVVAVR